MYASALAHFIILLQRANLLLSVRHRKFCLMAAFDISIRHLYYFYKILFHALMLMLITIFFGIRVDCATILIEWGLDR